MAIEKFKKNLTTLKQIMNVDELLEYFLSKDAFNEDFIKLIVESEYLKDFENIKNKEDYNLTITELKEKFLNYNIDYNKKNKKIKINISNNNIFSYLDNEKELIDKMNKLIKDENFEDAKILYNYLNMIDLKY
jgi:hypothetical protein